MHIIIFLYKHNKAKMYYTLLWAAQCKHKSIVFILDSHKFCFTFWLLLLTKLLNNDEKDPPPPQDMTV